MDGTLLDLHYDNYFWSTHLPRRYAELKNIPLAKADEELRLHIQSLEGTLNWYCLDYWSDSLELDIGALKSEIKNKIQERPYTIEFLQFLKTQNKTIALVTNAHPIGLNIKLATTSIGRYIDHTISSHQFKQPKEEQSFWHALQIHMPFDCKRTVFFDDSISVLQSAVDYGIKHVIGIHQPDSQQPRTLNIEKNNIKTIHHFDELLPKKRSS